MEPKLEEGGNNMSFRKCGRVCLLVLVLVMSYGKDWRWLDGFC